MVYEKKPEKKWMCLNYNPFETIPFTKSKAFFVDTLGI